MVTTHPMKPGTYTVSSGFGPRWGTNHNGQDFAAPLGTPIYATEDGVIVEGNDRSPGSVGGFGNWIWQDSQRECGRDFVYGHMRHADIYVRKGDRVKAGQLIARVGSEGGSTGPHLHFEEWTAPGRIGGKPVDPAPRLRGAKWPGGTTPAPKPTAKGEIFGVDVSEHQDGMSLKRAKQEGIDFAILRLCDGTYRDRTFSSHLKDAESAGLLVSTYWYLRAPSEGTTISQQVDVIDQQMKGRRDLSVWIDVESVSGSRKLLTEKDVHAAKRELEKRGYTVAGIYSGAWYWEKMPGGEPSMDGLGSLWVSHYGQRNAYGNYRTIYNNEGGANHPGWRYPLGDKLPDILQYGSNGLVAGKYVDVNAFKGTRAELAQVFGYDPKPTHSTPKPDFLEELMSNQVKSYVNESKSFAAPVALSLIDRQVWETRVLLLGLYRALGIDPHALITAAITADNQGGDVDAAITDTVNKTKEIKYV